jgi:hypothetical protein
VTSPGFTGSKAPVVALLVQAALFLGLTLLTAVTIIGEITALLSGACLITAAVVWMRQRPRPSR